mmetsp:Transcript_34776/g.78543  ORF Transcript_34776/g.78543 Transcript_34776/m.78543 type:complete len:254 (-) Transcript_34776:373-1134(-)
MLPPLSVLLHLRPELLPIALLLQLPVPLVPLLSQESLLLLLLQSLQLSALLHQLLLLLPPLPLLNALSERLPVVSLEQASLMLFPALKLLLLLLPSQQVLQKPLLLLLLQLLVFVRSIASKDFQSSDPLLPLLLHFPSLPFVLIQHNGILLCVSPVLLPFYHLHSSSVFHLLVDGVFHHHHISYMLLPSLSVCPLPSLLLLLDHRQILHLRPPPLVSLHPQRMVSIPQLTIIHLLHTRRLLLLLLLAALLLFS